MSEDVKTTHEVLTEVSEEVPVADFNSIMNLPVDRSKWINIPEWNSKVKLKPLTKAEQIKLRNASKVRGQVDDVKLEMNLIVFSLVDPKLTFDQVDQLYANSNATALNRISAAALSMSGLTEDYIEAAEQDMKS